MANKDLSFSVEKIEVGDTVYYYENGILQETKLVKMTNTGIDVPMYNVKYVKKNNTFFANDILVHNRYAD